MVLIVVTIIAMFVVLIFWSFTNLGEMNVGKKILWILIFLGMVILMTYATFVISKNNIEYPSSKIMHSVKNVLVLFFSGVNGCFLVPILCKSAEQLDSKEIDDVHFLRRVLLFIFILIILLAFECGYMKTTQKGILEIMYNNN